MGLRARCAAKESIMIGKKSSNVYSTQVESGEFDVLRAEEPGVTLRIRGLKAIDNENGLFELKGVTPRHCDWDAVMVALGYRTRDETDPDMLNDRDVLVDKLARVVYLDDIMKVLSARIA
jgi:hypothetical protein